MKKMTLVMVAKKLGCSVEWVRARVKENKVPTERMNDGAGAGVGTILIAEADLPKLGAPKRKFHKKKSVGKPRKPKAASVPRDANGRFDMKAAVAAALRGIINEGWKPKNHAEAKIADAMFDYLAS